MLFDEICSECRKQFSLKYILPFNKYYKSTESPLINRISSKCINLSLWSGIVTSFEPNALFCFLFPSLSVLFLLLRCWLLVLLFLPSGCFSSKAEDRLFRKLFRRYNQFIRPVENVSDPVTVEFEVSISQLVKVVSFPPPQKQTCFSTFRRTLV